MAGAEREEAGSEIKLPPSVSECSGQLSSGRNGWLMTDDGGEGPASHYTINRGKALDIKNLGFKGTIVPVLLSFRYSWNRNEFFN